MFFGQRNKFIKVIIWSVAILFGVTIFAGFSGYLSSRKLKESREEAEKKKMEQLRAKYTVKDEDKEKVLATFGADNITVGEFFDFFGKIGMDIQSNYKTVEQRETVLDYLVEREIIKNFAVQNGISVSDDDRLQVLMKNQGYKQYGYEKLKEMLDKNYFDRNQIDTAVFEEKVRKMVSDYNGKMDEKSLKAYYEEHKYRFQNSREYQISHIFIKNDNTDREKSINEKISKDAGVLERFYMNNQEKYLDSPQIRARGIFLALDRLPEVKVGDQEIRDYYDKNKEEFVEEEQVKASHILIDIKEKSKAQDIMKKILNGEKFEDLAGKYSKDPGSASRGGDLGWFGKGRMVPEFEKKAFSMKKGDISEPVETQFGYHIIRLDDRKDRTEKKFDDVREKIAKDLENERKWEMLRIKSETVMNEYEERESFESLVALHSQGMTKELDGDYGWLKKDMKSSDKNKDLEIFENGTLSYQVWSTLTDMSIAEVSEPVKLDKGYIILKKMSEKEAEPKPYEVVKDEVKRNYMEEEKERHARSVAQEALREIHEGMEFTKAVEKYSDGKTKADNGLLPWFPLGKLDSNNKDLVSVLDGEIAGMTFYFDNGSFRQGTVINKNIETEIRKMSKGDISGIIENSDGFSIIRLEDERDGSIKSFDEVKDEIRKDVDMKLSDSEIKDYYERNKASLYTEPENIKAAVILVSDEKKAEEIYKKLEEGGDFGKLAAQYSEDYTKDNGGVIDTMLKRGDRSEAFDEVAFSLNIGEFSKPVNTEYGFQIIRLLDKKAEKVFSLEEKKAEITEELLRPKRETVYRKWIQEQKNKFGVVKNYSNFEYLTKYFN